MKLDYSNFKNVFISSVESMVKYINEEVSEFNYEYHVFRNLEHEDVISIVKTDNEDESISFIINNSYFLYYEGVDYSIGRAIYVTKLHILRYINKYDNMNIDQLKEIVEKEYLKLGE